MKTIARFSTRRPVTVLLLWLAAIVGLQIINAAVGPDLRDSYSLKGTDSQAAYDLLGERFPDRGGDVDTLAWSVSQGAVTDPAVVAHMESVLAEIGAGEHVAAIISPYSPAGAMQLSADGTVAYAQIQYDATAYNLPLDAIETIEHITADADGTQIGEATLTVAQGGQAASRLSDPEVGPGEMIGVGIAAVILFFAFGSLIAATIPLISALVALTGTLAVLGLVSNFGPLSTNAPTMAALLGLGIGIDYALFIVIRHRLSLKAGRSVSDSVIGATTTSGRAVVFAGTTVFISLAGMYVPQITFLSGLATAAAITVVFSVAASITLVPALLQLFGHRVLNRRERAHLGESAAQPVVTPRRIARFVERRPATMILVTLGALAAIAIPALSLRLGNADQGNDPAGTSTRVAYDLVSQGFGVGSNGPLVVVVDLGEAAPFDPAQPPVALVTLLYNLQRDPGVETVLGPLPNPAGDAVVLQVLPSASPQDVATEELVNRIRGDYSSRAAGAGLSVYVGGTVASNLDFTEAIASSLPLFFAMVVGLSMLVLVLAFRTVVLPLVGALLNLVAALAAFGVVVAVFQWGWGHQLIGVGEGGPIEPFAPVILFALLFGLSMDYQVFLVSRVSELWHQTGDNGVAVRLGMAEVSRVIIAAASIMVAVFGSFVTSDARVMKLLGLGLAAAVLLDAFIIRVVLMPAVMHLLGRLNWWMPAWLDRILPHVDLDGETQSDAETQSASVSKQMSTAPSGPSGPKVGSVR